ncbi:DNA-binding protein [Duganella sp. FT109W]|uniref:DNA-binding protein n=1 Tax=Duganella margarita TaxID=2692170 RepID=A0ABW9WGY9_9BURK|nr:DNA-binding protein [Duganella margarita]MYN40411.1 DNA-binding protein [Duganella margarita]
MVVAIHLSVSPELNALLEQLAVAGSCTKSEVLRKAIALYDVAFEAKLQKNRLGILDQNKQLLTEIVGL